jgi:phage tail-like protein
MPGSPNVLGNCRFKVDIGGGDRYIKEVDSVAIETPATPYNIGMSSQGKAGKANFVQKPTVQQEATRIKLTVVAESKKTDMFDWYDKCNNQGQWKGNIKEASIRYYDESNSQALTINLTEAYPVSYSLATASSDGQEYLTEVVELTCTSMKLKS